MSRDTFYRVREAKESGGVEALLHKDRHRANLKNRMDEAAEAAILAFAVESSAAGQVRVSNELRKRGVQVSPAACVRCGCVPACRPSGCGWGRWRGRRPKEGLVLTESQIAALERKREE